LVHGFGCRRHAELDEAAHPAGHLAVHTDRRVEVLDVRGDANVKTRWVECADRADA